MSPDWASRVGENVEPATWNECVSALLSSGGDNVIYRGHGSFDWELWSALERALLEHAQRWDQHKYQAMTSMAADPETDQWAQEVETNLMQHFRRNAARFDIPGLPEAWDILGWWEVMQHHGAPTRLMDWSRSPFTAMWFALDRHGDGSGDMAS